PFSLTCAYASAALVSLDRREVQSTQGHAEALVALATTHHFPYRVTQGMVLRGWTLAAHGQEEAALAQIQQGLAQYRATGSAYGLPHYLAILAEVHGWCQQISDGLTAVTEALACEERSGQRFYMAELYRLQGELRQRAADSERHGVSGDPS